MSEPSGHSLAQQRVAQLQSDLGLLLSLQSSQQSQSDSLPDADMAGFIVESFRLASGMESNLRLGASGRLRWEAVKPVIKSEAIRGGVPWPLMAGLAWTESSFNPLAKGPVVGGFCEQAHGLFQICRGHFADLRNRGIWSNPENDWKDPRLSATAAVFLLRQHGLGRDDIEQVLKSWGGFVRTDHRPTRDMIINRSTFLFLESLTGR